MRKNILKVGLAHGVFDFIHIGHIEHFKEAKKFCDTLIISVTADKYVNKGPNRPAFNINERINLLKSIKYVDKVLISNSDTAVKSIKKIKPNIYFKGLDYQNVDKKNKNNLAKEIKALKKFGGKFIVTKSKLRSSSKILNENYNFLKKDVKIFLNTLNKKQLINKLKTTLFKNQKSSKLNSLLLSGEQIIDCYTDVKLQGKSQKSSVISAVKHKSKKYGGGTILVANLLSELMDRLTYLVNGNSKTINKLKNFLNNKSKLTLISTNTDIKKFLIKERFIENYSKARLFQLNQNQIFYKSNENKNFKKTFLTKIKQFNNVLIFDYGYGYFDEVFANNLKSKSNKFFINCQTNSSNYGFNLFSKYNKAEILCVDEAEFRLTVKNKEANIKDLLNKNKNTLRNYKIFIVTCGSKGCYILYKKKIYYIPTVFETTLDTTGCGDIFFSTFVFFYIQKIYTLNEISLFSHVAAGLHGLKEGNKNVVTKNYLFQCTQSILK